MAPVNGSESGPEKLKAMVLGMQHTGIVLSFLVRTESQKGKFTSNNSLQEFPVATPRTSRWNVQRCWKFMGSLCVPNALNTHCFPEFLPLVPCSSGLSHLVLNRWHFLKSCTLIKNFLYRFSSSHLIFFNSIHHFSIPSLAVPLGNLQATSLS